jgi:hypothetical protein
MMTTMLIHQHTMNAHFCVYIYIYYVFFLHGNTSNDESGVTRSLKFSWEQSNTFIL